MQEACGRISLIFSFMVKLDPEVDTCPAQVVWSRQCRKTVKFSLVQFLDKVFDVFPLDSGLKSITRIVLVRIQLLLVRQWLHGV